MKKRICRLTVLAALLICALTAAAWADTERCVTPDFEETVRNFTELNRMVDRGLVSRGGYVSLTKVSGDYLTETTWQATASGTGEHTYLFQLLRFDDAFSQGYELVMNQKESANNTFTGSVVASGRYELRVWSDLNTSQSAYNSHAFTVNNSAYPTMDARVEQIAADCLAAGCSTDFDKALWLHDWIIQNAQYDYDYHYYGSDGVLARGAGVCDSYAKAYFKLLSRVGIDCKYVTGYVPNGFHAWDAVKLDGEWYWLDPTWNDDSTARAGTLSGEEHYIYFALPSEAMSFDHECNNGVDQEIQCVAYTDNYYIHTGQVSLWTPSFAEDIRALLEGGSYTGLLTAPDYYKLRETDNFYYGGRKPIVYRITAYALRQMTWDAGGQLMPLDAAYQQEDNKMLVRLIFDGREIDLPANLQAIEEEAFGNVAFMSVNVPGTVRSIAANAFSHCANLWRVYLPNGIETIDPAAFADCPNLTLCGPADGDAAAYAAQNGLRFVAE